MLSSQWHLRANRSQPGHHSSGMENQEPPPPRHHLLNYAELSKVNARLEVAFFLLSFFFFFIRIKGTMMAGACRTYQVGGWRWRAGFI